MASTSVENAVNLSDLKLRCDPHAKSSLKHILTEYGLKVEKRRPKRKVQSAVHHAYPEKEKEEKLTLREERNLQVLKDMDILKKHYYDHYMDLLHQRIRQQEAKMKERELRQQKRSQTAAARPRKKLEKHVLVDDKEYLLKVPKSQAYEFIREEARLTRSGQLKTVSDVEEFWMHALLKSNMKRFKINDINQLAQLSSLDEGPEGRLEDITEDDEDAKMANKNVDKPWQQTRGGKKAGQKALSRKATKDHDEKLFPKVEMPKLHCFDMELGPPEEDPAEAVKDQEKSARDKERWVFRKRLQKMYQLAMTNTASAKRIMANHDEEDVEIMMDSSDVKELIDLDHFISKRDLLRYSSPSSALVPCRSPDRGRSALDSGQESRSCRSGQERVMSGSGQERVMSGASERDSVRSRSIVSRETDSKRSTPSRRSRRSDESSGIASASPPIPLSMGDVLPEARIMEAKCLSTLWTNYTKEETS